MLSTLGSAPANASLDVVYGSRARYRSGVDGAAEDSAGHREQQVAVLVEHLLTGGGPGHPHVVAPLGAVDQGMEVAPPVRDIGPV